MKKLGSWLLIREGEGKSALFFMLLFMCMGAGIAIGKGSADALFLKRYGVENLAYVYLGLAVLLALVATVYAAFVDRISAERFLFLLFGIQLVALVASWLFMDVLRQSSIYPVYYALYALSSELLVVHGGVYIGQNLNTLQSKRLAPLIFGGYQLGMMIGGLLLVSVIAGLGLNSAPLAWGVCVLLSFLLLAWWHGKNGVSPFYFPPSKRKGSQIQHALDEVRQGFDFTRRTALLKNASFALVFMVITFYMLSYSAHVIYNQTFQSEQELLGFFGVLVIATNIGAIVFQFFITNRVMAWMGVRRTKYIYPVTTVLSFVALLVHPGFLAALFASINRETIMPAFRTPVRQMFFNVLPEYMKGRARAIMIAVVMPFALFVCGLLIIAMQHFGNLTVIAAAGFILSLIYLYYCVRMGKSYVTTLIESMKAKLFLPEQTASLYKDKNSGLLSALRKGLGSKNDLVSLSYAKALMSSYPEVAVDMILNRVRNAGVAVADQMVRLIHGNVDKQCAQKLLRHADQGDSHLQATIYDVINSCEHDNADELIAELLNSPSERIRASGIKAAFSHKDTANKVSAVTVWYGLLEGSYDKQLAALGLLPVLDAYDGLDRDHMIKLYQKSMSGLLSEADTKRKSHIYGLIKHWRWELPGSIRASVLYDIRHVDPYLRSAAAQCLHALPEGEARTRALWDCLDDGHLDVRKAALASLNMLYPDYRSIYSEWLIGNKTGTPRAQKMLLESLIASGSKQTMLEQIVLVKSAYAADLLCAVSTMKDHAAVDACHRVTEKALEERLHQIVDLALMALQPIMDSNTIAVIRAAISSKDSRFTASANEALQCLKNRQFVHLLTSLVARDYSLTVKAGSGRFFLNVDDVYRWCMSLDDPWLHTCGVYGYQTTKE
jgi:AAA family ATP:ADP antiporter